MCSDSDEEVSAAFKMVKNLNEMVDRKKCLFMNETLIARTWLDKLRLLARFSPKVETQEKLVGNVIVMDIANGYCQLCGFSHLFSHFIFILHSCLIY